MRPDQQPDAPRPERTDHAPPSQREDHERPSVPAEARRQGDGDDRPPADAGLPGPSGRGDDIGA
jgi:hypothetical protein